jgi:hypothetical protein
VTYLRFSRSDIALSLRFSRTRRLISAFFSLLLATHFRFYSFPYTNFRFFSLIIFGLDLELILRKINVASGGYCVHQSYAPSFKKMYLFIYYVFKSYYIKKLIVVVFLDTCVPHMHFTNKRINY